MSRLTLAASRRESARVRGGREDAQVADQYLLRPAEAAQKLAVCRSTIYTLISEGQIPYVRVGKSLRVPADRLREVIDGRITINTPDTPVVAA